MTDKSMRIYPMPEDLADQASDLLWDGYQKYVKALSMSPKGPGERFERRDWQGMRQDTVQRLDLYPKVVKGTYRKVADCLGLQAQDANLWRKIKPHSSRRPPTATTPNWPAPSTTPSIAESCRPFGVDPILSLSPPNRLPMRRPITHRSPSQWRSHERRTAS